LHLIIVIIITTTTTTTIIIVIIIIVIIAVLSHRLLVPASPLAGESASSSYLDLVDAAVSVAAATAACRGSDASRVGSPIAGTRVRATAGAQGSANTSTGGACSGSATGMGSVAAAHQTGAAAAVGPELQAGARDFGLTSPVAEAEEEMLPGQVRGDGCVKVLASRRHLEAAARVERAVWDAVLMEEGASGDGLCLNSL